MKGSIELPSSVPKSKAKALEGAEQKSWWCIVCARLPDFLFLLSSACLVLPFGKQIMNIADDSEERSDFLAILPMGSCVCINEWRNTEKKTMKRFFRLWNYFQFSFFFLRSLSAPVFYVLQMNECTRNLNSELKQKAQRQAKKKGGKRLSWVRDEK